MSPLQVALEITPPLEPRLSVLQRRAAALGKLPHDINVIHRLDRWSSLEASIALHGRGFAAVWHVPNRGRRVRDLEREIRRAADAGLRRVLCMRGEYKAEDAADTPRIHEVVRMIRRALPDGQIGVTLNHHLDPTRALRNLRPKLAAGADRVQTQLTFDLDSLRPFADRLKSERPALGIVPMLMPTLSACAATRLCRRLSIPIPRALVERLARHGAAAGWEHFEGMLAEIAHGPLYAGVALMTPMDPDADYANRLAASVRRWV